MVYGTDLVIDLRKGYKISDHSIYDIIGNCAVIEYDDYFSIVSLNSKRIDIFNQENKYAHYRYDQGYILVEDLNQKWGVLSADGDVIIEPIYDYIIKCDDVYIVRIHGREGLLDLNGKSITPIIYDTIKPFEGDVTVFSRNLGEGLLDKSGNESLYDKYTHILVGFQKGYAPVLNDKKRGIIDESGEEVIPPIYSSISILGYDYFACSLYDDTKEQRYGLFKKNKQILSFKYQSIRLVNPDRFIVRDVHDHYLLINSLGKTIKRLKQRPYILGPNIISYSGYLVNSDGKHIIPKKHNGYIFCGPDLVAYKWKDLYGMKKSNGEVVATPQYEEFIVEQDIIRVKQDGKWGLLDLDGHIIKQPIYDEMSKLKNGYFIISRKDRGGSGLLDMKGNEILASEYQFSYFEVNDNFILLTYSRGYCLINRNDNQKHYIEGPTNDIKLLNDHQIVVNNCILNVNDISFVFALSIIKGQNLTIKYFDTEEEMNQYLVKLKKETIERHNIIKSKKEELVNLFLEFDRQQLYNTLMDNQKQYKEQLGLDLINEILELKQTEENDINDYKEDKIKKLGLLLDNIDNDVKELR